MRFVSKSILKQAFPRRREWNHKGEHGRLLVIAGSGQYTGSPVFNCMGALRAGCDLVHLYAPRRPADVAANYAPDPITLPFNGTHFTPREARKALFLLHEYDALVIGGGLGPHPKTRKAILELLSRCTIPAVVDADALRALEDHTSIVHGKPFVLTPHANEFLALGGKRVGTAIPARAKEVQRIAAELGVAVLLKGGVDVISDGRNTMLNQTGTPFMTKGGGGDVLAGVAGALLARRNTPFESACAAAYITGRAGEIASKKRKEGYIASDLFEALPQAIS